MIHLKNDFAQWLESRYEYDNQARSKSLEEQLIDHFKMSHIGKTLNIVDLGTGIGSNVRYFIPIFQYNQRYAMIDNDISLITMIPNYLKKSLSQLKWNNKKNSVSNELIFSNSKYVVEIKSYCTSLTNFHQDIDINKFDLIVANAVFDLISRDQFNQLIQNIIDYKKLALLFTLNYNGMNFIFEGEIPEQTDYYIDLYEQHMKREQSFGNAMGKDCTHIIANILNEHGYQTLITDSNWKIDSSDHDFALMILSFMENSIPQMLNYERIEQFTSWCVKIKQSIVENRIQILISHKDILAIKWPENI